MNGPEDVDHVGAVPGGAALDDTLRPRASAPIGQAGEARGSLPSRDDGN